MQRKQMTTLGKTYSIIAINGKFDDCQRLVKNAFLDPSSFSCSAFISKFNKYRKAYYLSQFTISMHGQGSLKNVDEKVIFSVPSGNFGNLMGGLIASKNGTSCKEVCYINKCRMMKCLNFLETGIYKAIVPSINCISSAMNVGHPSNLARIVVLLWWHDG